MVSELVAEVALGPETLRIGQWFRTALEIEQALDLFLPEVRAWLAEKQAAEYKWAAADLVMSSAVMRKVVYQKNGTAISQGSPSPPYGESGPVVQSVTPPWGCYDLGDFGNDREDLGHHRLWYCNWGEPVYYHVRILEGGDDYAYCNSTLSAPHEGDGNNRYGNGYNWLPSWMRVTFTEGVTPGKNRIKVEYKHYSSRYSALTLDDNEALEVECYLYNYLDCSEQYRGYAFLKMDNPVWTTNIPGGYLDTAFGDSDDVVAVCVGCPDALDMSAYTAYWWEVTSTEGERGYNYDGYYKVVAQRSYFHDTPLMPIQYDIFGEEHDPIRNLCDTSKINSNGWVLESAYDNPVHTNYPGDSQP